MKHIPIGFPLLFLLIPSAPPYFAGAYAIAAGAVAGQGDVGARVADRSSRDGSDLSAPRDQMEWYESAAVLVCPLH